MIFDSKLSRSRQGNFWKETRKVANECMVQPKVVRPLIRKIDELTRNFVDL